jgi:lipooligosaccharide transport system ATP-binding protein
LMESAVLANGLTKTFDTFTAVDGIDFEVQAGETFALLGPNGAGKTSTMRMVATVSRPTSGSLQVLGFDAHSDGRQIRSRLGVVPQEDQLDIELTVRENLMTYARYFGQSWASAGDRASELLEFAELSDRADSRVESLSGGMKRRITIARALVNDPELVLLDEPTTGLDPQARQLLWDRLYELKERGVTQLLTTHYMDEAEQLADRLVIMDGGAIVAAGSPSELIRSSTTAEVVELRTKDQVTVDDGQPIRVENLRNRTLLYADDGAAALAHVHSRGIETSSALIRRATLEDVFLALTGRQLVD